MRTVGIIPARKGSRRIPHKNTRLLGGYPLVVWTFKEALKAKELDRVVVSTDDEEVKRLAEEHDIEVPFFPRPGVISADCDTALVVKHCIGRLEREGDSIDVAVTLQPTSPFRTSTDINSACGLMHQEVDSVVSVTEVTQHPAWMFYTTPPLRGGPYLRSYLGFPLRILSGLIAQDLPKLYFPNGAIYVTQKKVVNQCRIYGDNNRPYLMPFERSLDIEEEIDFKLAEAMLQVQSEDKAMLRVQSEDN